MTLLSLSGLFIAITTSVLLLILLFYGKTKLHRVWTFLNVAVFIWGVGTFLIGRASTPLQASISWKIAGTGGLPLAVFFYHTVYILSNLKKKKVLLFVYLQAFIFWMLMCFTKEGIVFGGWRLVFDSLYYNTATIGYTLMMSSWAVVAVLGHYDLSKFIRKSRGIKRTQGLYLLIGFIIGFIGGASILLPAWGISFYPFGNIGVALYAIIGTYAILRYRLMDIRVVAARTTIFLLVYILVLGLPFWFGYKTGLWVWAVGLMGVLASAGPSIYNYFRKKAENILLHEQNRYQKALKDFSSTLIFIRDTEELSEKIVIKIMDAVNLDFCAVYLKQDGDFSLRSKKITNHPQLPDKIKMDSEFSQMFKGSNAPRLGEFIPALDGVKIGLACPLFLNQNLYGFIILGHKEKEALFTDTDIDAFSIVSNQVSLALSEIYYFNEFQKATEEKYKLLVEKERLQSAFEIAEAYRHELGNILNIISTSLGNLMFIGDTTPTKEEIEQTRKSINNNVKRGHKIFSAISEYNESSKLEPKEARLDELIKAAINDKEEDLSKNNISLKADIGENIALLANDNLISALRYFLEGAIGAIEYVNPKVRLIDIKLKSQDGLAELIISDTGGDATADKLYTGIGIERAKEGGILYFIARRIIFDHQGKLEMVSFDNGKGTSFLIKIPLKKV